MLTPLSPRLLSAAEGFRVLGGVPHAMLSLLACAGLLVVVFGVVPVVALVRARPEDVPAVFAAFGAVVGRYAGRLPGDRGTPFGGADSGAVTPTAPEKAR